MRKMLINASQPEETRIAITENDRLFDIDIEHVDHEQNKANIYKAKISRVEPSLNAVFVNYGEQKNGFLPAKEISPEYFSKKVNPNENLPPLNELLTEGQELIVQISKEERGTKGAALTTFITLAGCYVVLMPNNPNSGGISRRIEGKERDELKKLIDSMNMPDGMGIIVRTAGVDRTPKEIQWDLDILINLWEAIQEVIESTPAPFLIHRESDITMRAIRDYLREDINEIVVDTEDAFQDLSRQITMLRPDFIERLVLHEGSTPLFSKYHIESQIENAYQREVRLPSGGSIVIDNTEALTAIDVNSAKSTKRGNIEDTALHTNLEAAEEAARQIRLRDIGGLIIIDFIDMDVSANQKDVENALAGILQRDRAKIHMARISKFGLVEISRQRLSASLDETSTITCPRCEGQGIIRSVQSLSLSLLRLIEEEALKDKTNEVRAQLPIAVSTFLLNEKRQAISELEQKLNVKVVLIPNSNLDTPHYKIQRIWGEVYNANRPSHDLIESNSKDANSYDPSKTQKNRQQPAIRSVKMNAAPQNQKQGFFSKLIKAIAGSDESENKPQKSNEVSKKTQENAKPVSTNNKPENRNNRKPNNRNQQQNDRPNQKNTNERQNKPKYANSNRTNIHKSEELVDISAHKNEIKNKPITPTSTVQPIKKPSGLQATPLVYTPKSVNKISTEDHITKMVKDVLENSSSLAIDNSTQVETEANNIKSERYLKFDSVDLNKVKAETTVTDTKSQTVKEEAIVTETKSQTVKEEAIVTETKNQATNEDVVVTETKSQTVNEKTTQKEEPVKKEKKEEIKPKDIQEYNPAIDPSSQGFVSETKNTAKPKSSAAVKKTSSKPVDKKSEDDIKIAATNEKDNEIKEDNEIVIEITNLQPVEPQPEVEAVILPDEKSTLLENAVDIPSEDNIATVETSIDESPEKKPVKQSRPKPAFTDEIND